MFRNPKPSNSAQVQNKMPLTSKTPLIDSSQQESISTNSDETVLFPFLSGNKLSENIVPSKQFNIPNGQNESTEALLTVPDAIQIPRKTTPNFSRRELVSRKSALILHPLDVDPSPQAVQAQGLSEPRLVTSLFATPIDTENHGDTTLGTATAISPSPRQFYKIILLGAGAVGKSPLAMQVGGGCPNTLPADLTIIIVRLSVL